MYGFICMISFCFSIINLFAVTAYSGNDIILNINFFFSFFVFIYTFYKFKSDRIN